MKTRNSKFGTRNYWAFTWIAALLIAMPAPAAPASDAKTAEPAVIVQVKSIDQLLDTVKTSAAKFLAEPMYKEFEKEVLGKLDLNMIKGIDTKKPIGLYVVVGGGLLQGDFAKSSVVALVPITDEKEFIALFDKIGLKLEKKGDAYSIAIPVPISPMEVSLQFSKGYAYIAVATETPASKSLLDAKELFNDKETAALALRIRIDRLPDDFKSAGLDHLTTALDALKNIGGQEERFAIVEPLLNWYAKWIKLGVNDGKELTYRLDLDASTGAIVVEMNLEPKKGTELAKSIADMKPTKNDFAGIVGPDSAAHVLMQTPLFIEEVKTMLSKAVEWGGKEAEKKMEQGAPKEARDAVAELFKMLGRTVNDGNFDVAASLRGPDKNDQYTAIGAFTLKDSAAFEKSLKAALKVAPNEVAQVIKVDAFKVGAVNVHEVAVGDKLPPEAQKIFGKSSIYLAMTPNAAFITFGPQGEAMLKDALTQKLGPKPAPLLQADISGKRMMPLLKSAGVPLDGETRPYFEKLAKMDRISVYTVKLEGGDKFSVRYEIGLAPVALMMVTRMGQAQAVPLQQAVPLPPKK